MRSIARRGERRPRYTGSMRPRFALAALSLALFSGLAFGQQVPRPAGEFAMSMNNGSQVLLSQYTGKVVVLAFMYTTWPHCQRTAQVLSGIQKEYGPQGLQILAAAYNPNAPNLVPDFIRNYGVNFPMGFVSREEVQEYAQRPPGKPGYVPELFFIDRNRVIRAQYSGTDDFFKDQDRNIRTQVETLLKEPVASKKTAHSARKKRSWLWMCWSRRATGKNVCSPWWTPRGAKAASAGPLETQRTACSGSVLSLNLSLRLREWLRTFSDLSLLKMAHWLLARRIFMVRLCAASSWTTTLRPRYE
jgi:peroxiredoxin